MVRLAHIFSVIVEKNSIRFSLKCSMALFSSILYKYMYIEDIHITSYNISGYRLMHTVVLE